MTGTGENNVASGTGGSPTWLAVLAATSLGVIFLIAGLSFGSLSADSEPGEEPELAEAPDSDIQPSPLPDLPQKPAGDWTAALYGSECPAPCSAGTRCATSEDNTFESRYCSAADKTCGKCASGITCVPGEAKHELALGESWELYSSQILLKEQSAGSRANFCSTPREFWACLRPSGTDTEWVCLGPHGACEPIRKSQESIPILTDDLVKNGLDIELRRDPEDSTPYLRKRHATISDGMKRRGLCSGFKLDVGRRDGVEFSILFFLEPE